MQAKFENQENALYKRRVSREPRQMVRPPPPQQSSNQDLEPETTGLSAYLNFGALSVRTLWLSATTVDEQTTVTVHGQLLYREFFYCVAFTVSISFTFVIRFYQYNDIHVISRSTTLRKLKGIRSVVKYPGTKAK